MTVDDRKNSEQPHPDKRNRRRHAFLAGLIISVGILAVVLLALFLYRFGYVDRYVAGQIKNTFANYGIRATIK
jgi:hypothetical protein